MPQLHADALQDPVERPAGRALRRGWFGCCPHCGTGRIFGGYLSVNRNCPSCGEELYHHRADDGPAYLTILLVGHLIAPFLLVVFIKYRPEPLTLVTMFSMAVVALSLFLLPRFKGAMIGLQWAKRMHGFGWTKDRSGQPALPV